MTRQLHAAMAALLMVALSACTAVPSAAPPPAAAPSGQTAVARPVTATDSPTGQSAASREASSVQGGPSTPSVSDASSQEAIVATAAAATGQTARPTVPAAAATGQTVTGDNVATPVSITPEELARQTLEHMTLEQKVGQVFMLGFDGTTLNDSNRALIQGLHLGGVTLFARNIDNGPQLSKLDHDLQTIADPVPLFISVDQEGGLVVRVSDQATIFPGNMAVGATGDPNLARQIAAASANELLAMGVNMDLAPVVDVNTNPLNPVIGTRSFGSDADLVSQFATQAIEGVQAAGVSAVAKHFPGHGDTDVDSHRDLPVVPHPLERLESLEFLPFQAAMRAGVDGVMTAHLYLPAIEPQQDLPATLSRTVLTGLLRDKLGYDGLILTDALDMDAIKKDRSAAEAAVQAFDAGADLLLIAGINADDRMRLGDGPPALLAAVQSGRISEARLDQSVQRILEAKARRGVLPGAVSTPATPDTSVLNNPEHRALALDVARKAVTLQRDHAGLLPLPANKKILVVEAPEPTRSDVVDDQLASSLLDAVKRFAPSAVGASSKTAVDAARSADVVVLGTFDLARTPAQQTLARQLAATGKPIVMVSLRGPYDAAVATEVGTVLTVYGDRPIHLQAAAEALFGRLTPAGKAP